MSLCPREAAQRAIQTLDNYEVRPGKFIGVCMSLDNCRLFIGSIPKDKKKDEIMEEMKRVQHTHTHSLVHGMCAGPQLSRAWNINKGFG